MIVKVIPWSYEGGIIYN